MIIKIGVLAIQGGFTEHISSLLKCSRLPELIDKQVTLETIELRSPTDVSHDIDGIIIPGGESTATGRLLSRDGFGSKLTNFINGNDTDRKPLVWGTCSGMIVLADQIDNQSSGGQFHLGGLDVTVSRNFFGRQLNSFEATVQLDGETFADNQTCDGVFIRAPAVTSVNSNDVKVLGHIIKDGKCVVVAVRQNNKIATAFHPELTEDLLWHLYFIKLIIDLKNECENEKS